MHKIIITILGILLGLFLLQEPRTEPDKKVSRYEFIQDIRIAYGKSPEQKAIDKAIETSRDPKIARMIVDEFGDENVDFIAIFTAESGLNPMAVNWNCYYGDVSRACDEWDRYRAWSVDCGVAQLNISGRECPRELFDPQINIQKAKEKFDRQGRGAWVAFKNDAYLQYK